MGTVTNRYIAHQRHNEKFFTMDSAVIQLDEISMQYHGGNAPTRWQQRLVFDSPHSPPQI